MTDNSITEMVKDYPGPPILALGMYVVWPLVGKYSLGTVPGNSIIPPMLQAFTDRFSLVVVLMVHLGKQVHGSSPIWNLFS